MKKFWISWWQQADTSFELHSPWWRTGFDDDDNYSVCAAILAEDEEHAHQIVLDAQDDIEAFTHRFTVEKDTDWSPFNDRFRRADWMEWPG